MYSARITRQNPTAFVFLIDRSGSMNEKMLFGNRLMTKAEAVAMVTNMLIRELINRCHKDDGIADYFDIAAIGYSANEAQQLLGSENSFVKPSQLATTKCPIREFTHERIMPDGKTILVSDRLKYWIQPKAEGSTPMKSALEEALKMVGRWCKNPANNRSYPPTIFNITDGEASDGDSDMLVELAEDIKKLGTKDGNALLININLTSGNDGEAVVFPSSVSELPHSRYTEMLFQMSSIMPDGYREAITQLKGEDKEPPFRGMSYNASVADLIAMMNIGSLSINKIL